MAVPYRVGVRFAAHPAPLTRAARSPRPPEEPREPSDLQGKSHLFRGVCACFGICGRFYVVELFL